MAALLVIVIDDNREMLVCHEMMISDFLPHAEILCSQNAKDILDRMDTLLVTHEKIICITDNEMSEMSGFELIKNLHNRGIHFPTIMISGSNEEEKAKMLGMEYIEKPFQEEEFEVALRKIV